MPCERSGELKMGIFITCAFQVGKQFGKLQPWQPEVFFYPGCPHVRHCVCVSLLCLLTGGKWGMMVESLETLPTTEC